jgi:N-acetylglucosamine-6-phosphate deacetylase
MSFHCFDLQVNGHGGVDFSSPGLTKERLIQSVREVAECGTTCFLPTIITSPRETYQQNLPILGTACSQCPSLLGIHLEGPFICPEDGAVGAHPKACVQAPSIDRFKRLQEWAAGEIRLVTLAPERPGALPLVEYLVEHEVLVSVGHTRATSQQIQDACAAGATLATHLGNGLGRPPLPLSDPVRAILASPLSVMLITDGVHLSEEFLKTVYALKGADKIILTSDAAPVAGCPPGEYEIFGTRVRLTENGRVENLNAPTLAGSAATLAQCVEVCKKVLKLDENEVEKMGAGNAAKLLNGNAFE